MFCDDHWERYLGPEGVSKEGRASPLGAGRVGILAASSGMKGKVFLPMGYRLLSVHCFQGQNEITCD